MTMKLWLCTLLAGIGLLGCAATQDPRAKMLVEAPVGCNPGICFVDVWIANCDQAGGIETDPYKLEVTNRGKAKNIRWRIRNEGYIFADNGIVITNPDGEFDEPEMGADGKMFKWRDKHSVTKPPGLVYKYSVNVVKTGDAPRKCLTYDPLIANQ